MTDHNQAVSTAFIKESRIDKDEAADDCRDITEDRVPLR